MKRKFKLEGILTLRDDLSSSRKKEIAAKLDLPDNEDNQKDLMFMSAILVSTGTNKNGAHFLGSELIKARKTIAQKPLNIEHQERAIIGHISEWLYMDQSGKILDDEELYKSVVNTEGSEHHDEGKMKENCEKLDAMDMDIGIICAVYKDRFPEVAEDIEMGRYKVSMECYYESFDVKVGDFILPRDMAKDADLSEMSKNNIDPSLIPQIRSVASGKSLGNIMVSRVLRDIHFCGVGIVENPANVRSLILEAAKKLKNKVSAVGVTDRMVASIDLEDVQEDLWKIKLEVSEMSINDSYAVMKGNNVIAIFDTVEEAKTLAAELVFKEAHLNPDKNWDEESVLIAEVFGSFSPSGKFEESTCTYEVADGIVEVSSEVMASTKICKIIDGKTVCEDEKSCCSSCQEGGECCSSKEESLSQSDPRVDTREEVVKQKIDAPLENDGVTMPDKLPVDTDEKPRVHSIPVADPEDEEDTAIAAAPSPAPSAKVNPIRIPKAPAPTPKQERASLANDQFGLRSSRKFPIHTSDRILANMDFFTHTKVKLEAKEAKEFFNNLVKAALKMGIDTTEFEKSQDDQEFKDGEDYSSKFGVPRLKKFPLDNKEQVISAMSRFTRLSMELSEMEREGLYINILRAAARLGINTDSFRERVKNSKK